MGPSDQDVPFANVTAAKTVSVGAFYMDETEITNNEYRQFTNWVRDSLAHRILGDAGIEGHLIEEDEYGNFIEPALINCKEKIRPIIRSEFCRKFQQYLLQESIERTAFNAHQSGCN